MTTTLVVIASTLVVCADDELPVSVELDVFDSTSSMAPPIARVIMRVAIAGLLCADGVVLKIRGHDYVVERVVPPHAVYVSRV